MAGQPESIIPELTTNDRELISLVSQKLRRLRSSFDFDPDEAELRDYVCVNLRFLLLDGNYQIAWNKLIRERLVIPANDLNKMIGDPLLYDDFAQTAGAKIGPWQLDGGIILRRGPRVRNTPPAPSDRSKDCRTSFTVKRFLDSPCIVTERVFARRRHIIQYVAYRCGGVHLGPTEARDEQAFKMLDRHEHRSPPMAGPMPLKVFGHRTVYLELLSIGQALVNSPDCARILKAAEKAVPPTRPNFIPLLRIPPQRGS